MIEVIDAVMGIGKSTRDIKKIIESPKVPRVIVVPFLSEVERYARELRPNVDNLIALDSEKTFGRRKLDELHQGLIDGSSVITTHKLWDYWTEETIKFIESNGKYELLLDETLSLVNQEHINPVDFSNVLRIGLAELEDTSFRGMQKVVLTEDGYDYLKKEGDGKLLHRSFLKRVECGNLFVLPSSKPNAKELYYMICPPEKVLKFNKATLLTYMFKGSETEQWFKLWNLDYKIKRLTRAGDMSWNLSDHDGDYSGDGAKYAELIDIERREKYNAIGRRGNNKRAKHPLSSNYYRENPVVMKQIRKHLYSLLYERKREPVGVRRKRVMWSCKKALREYMWDTKFDPAAKSGLTEMQIKEVANWVPYTTRATNKYADRDILALVHNIFPHSSLNTFFEYHGLKIDDDQYALSMMLQWVFRSAIRKEKKVYLYLPSERMRKLLEDWLYAGENAYQKAA